MTEFDMKYLRYIQERYNLKQSIVLQEMKMLFKRLEEIKELNNDKRRSNRKT